MSLPTPSAAAATAAGSTGILNPTCTPLTAAGPAAAASCAKQPCASHVEKPSSRQESGAPTGERRKSRWSAVPRKSDAKRRWPRAR